MQLRNDAGPVIGFGGAAELRIELRQAVQHEALELRHVRNRQRFGVRKSRDGAEQPAQRVADAAVQLGLLLEDLLAQALIFGDVGIHHP